MNCCAGNVIESAEERKGTRIVYIDRSIVGATGVEFQHAGVDAELAVVLEEDVAEDLEGVRTSLCHCAIIDEITRSSIPGDVRTTSKIRGAEISKSPGL